MSLIYLALLIGLNFIAHGLYFADLTSESLYLSANNTFLVIVLCLCFGSLLTKIVLNVQVHFFCHAFHTVYGTALVVYNMPLRTRRDVLFLTYTQLSSNGALLTYPAVHLQAVHYHLFRHFDRGSNPNGRHVRCLHPIKYLRVSRKSLHVTLHGSYLA